MSCTHFFTILPTFSSVEIYDVGLLSLNMKFPLQVDSESYVERNMPFLVRIKWQGEECINTY